MKRFGLITEGKTDQAVIQAILNGFFDPEEVDITGFLPQVDNTGRHQIPNFSNWGLVLDYCASAKFGEALPYVDYIVVQIDTDQCDDAKFGVRKEKDGVALPPLEIVKKVSDKLIGRIGDAIWSKYKDRIIFAIAVETTECWLLPLYVPARDHARHLNCLHVLNTYLRRKNLKAINPDAKSPAHYAELARPYNKQKELTKRASSNPSLNLFVMRLEDLRASLQSTMPVASLLEGNNSEISGSSLHDQPSSHDQEEASDANDAEVC